MYDKRFEFRCTYLHTNMSLAKYLQKMNVEHQKISGEAFDYNKIRYPWTELTPLELEYCQNDVLGLVEAYREEMRRENDRLGSVPMTSTGYVRRNAKRAMQLASHHQIVSLLPDLKQYLLLRGCFRGGDVHANRYFADRILENVHSADRSSSYPDVICNSLFPTTKFRWIQNPTMKNIRYHLRKHHAVAMRIAVWNITLRDPYDGFPYLSRDKCEEICGGVFDNGRVLKADYLETSMTDVDFEIVERRYKWTSIKGLEAMWSHYGPLPRPLVQCAIDYYRRKTELKGIKTEDGGAEYMYAKSKELLNSLYGMMAQDPVKFNIEFREGDQEIFTTVEDDPGRLLEKYNSRAFLAYQWGCWTTAHARAKLEEGRRIVEQTPDAYPVYCDTDSIKYLGSVDWTEFNRRCVDACLESGAHATDPQGVEHYMGVYEREEDMLRFKTLGSKKYAYETEDGRLHITVAGVPKKAGARELAAAGGLDVFGNGFTFANVGKLETVYNDTPGSRWIRIDDHAWELGPNVYLRPISYTLGMTYEYMELLSDPLLFLDIKKKTLLNKGRHALEI